MRTVSSTQILGVFVFVLLLFCFPSVLCFEEGKQMMTKRDMFLEGDTWYVSIKYQQ